MPPAAGASFGPDRRVALALIAAAAVTTVLCVASPDAAGRLLYGLAVLFCLSVGLADLAVTPRLSVDADGLTVRHGATLRRTTLPWSHVDGVAVDERVRHGLASATLEIDDGTNLILLGRHALGRDPREAARMISAFAPAR